MLKKPCSNIFHVFLAEFDRFVFCFLRVCVCMCHIFSARMAGRDVGAGISKMRRDILLNERCL